MSDTTPQFLPAYEDMVKAGMHFGRKKTVFNPNMKPYVFMLKDRIHILDLVKTSECLINAVEFLKKTCKEEKLVLFVGLTKQSVEAVKKTAQELKMPYVINRWLGGTLTNFKTIISRVKHLEDLEKEKETGGFEKYTKKERTKKEKEIANLCEKFDGLRSLSRVPDVIFVSSLKEGKLPIHEAKIAGVKTVGIVNTDSDPRQLNYPISANDNSKKSVEIIMKTIIRGVKEED